MNNFIIALRRAAALVPGARRVKHRLLGTGGHLPVAAPSYRPERRGPAPKANRAELEIRYRGSSICQTTDSFVLYRIIGNDLPPRHVAGQSRRNLQFILQHEAELRGCEKRFVVNRIADPVEETAVLELIKEAGFQHIHIPFDWNRYSEIPWDIEGVPIEYAPWTERYCRLTDDSQAQVLMRLYRHKNNYVMNNNGARNAALRDGRNNAKWVLPWDGNCFVTESGWEEVLAAVREEPQLPYFIVPMARVTDGSRLLEANFRPPASEEPQIVFRRDSLLEFNPDYYYGHRPKVELLWRLGVSGQWDSWPVMPWDFPCPAYTEEAGAYGQAGWVARLPSGHAHLELSDGPDSGGGMNAAFKDRGIARVEAIKLMLDDLDEKFCDGTRTPPGTCLPATADADGPVMARLREVASEALARGPYSVVDKLTLPPSGNRHDYWHPAPYYWPNPLRLPGLPYVRRDGRRVPGTQLYEPLSDKYDRTRLQRMFDDTFVLTLMWRICRDQECAQHAAALVRTWFINPKTAMTPHLEYAQVRLGHDANKGSNSGIIELKDLYYFLDAVRLLQTDQWLLDSETVQLEEWFGKYLHWLRTSRQGQAERASGDNHGTYYDLQISAIAAYLGEVRLVRETLRDSRSRMLQQFDAAGRQSYEMQRTNTAHYCCFNLQGWIHLAHFAAAWGEDLWFFQASDGRGIRRAMEWLVAYIGKIWPHLQIEKFDYERFYPIYHTYLSNYGDFSLLHPSLVPDVKDIKPVFFPHDGIMPFWQLAYVNRGAS